MSHANYDVSALSAYVEQNRDLLIKNVAFGAGIRERISIQTGVKYKEHLHPFSVDPTFGDGSDCAFSAAGTAAFSQREIECPAIKTDMEICPRNLIGKYAEYAVRINAKEDKLPFEEYFVNQLIDGIKRKIEVMLWLGDKTLTTDTTKKWIDGFIKIATTSVSGSTGVIGVSISAGKSAYEGILSVYNSIPENALNRGAEIYVSPAIFRAFKQDLVAMNLFHYNPGNDNAGEFILPGTDTKVVRMEGLTGDLHILATFPENMYYGCDLQSDSEDVDLWFSKDNRTVRCEVLWNSGVQIAFLDQVVLGTFASAPSALAGVLSQLAAMNTQVSGINTQVSGINTAVTGLNADAKVFKTKEQE